MRTNADRLVMISVLGEVTNPTIRSGGYRITHDGRPVVLPGVGGITYNLRVGDPAVGWAADHVEPGVSLRNLAKDKDYLPDTNYGLNYLACVGNEARVATGDAKGARGVVTGKHGGIEHVLVDFQPEVLEKLQIGDKVLIKAYGVGLEFPDHPQVRVMNLDPGLLEVLPLWEEDGRLVVGVTHTVPAAIMGSGLGADTCYRGDYDIQLFDEATVEEYGLADLRFGDLVAILDTDHSYGRVYKQGALSIGIVVHSDCVIAGHGPGVTTLFTSSQPGALGYRIEPRANLADVLGLRE
ncbi:TPA: DUF4438 domain-containing protein [Candidatus Bipolaricaulota bacterium]|nr:DUF4438 domain-containing protein [Candidatus Bipolaricaulota bacterium]HIP99431.1 DUF4438 domain-containing protein [Candidatus Bipolaricaulota bacterium]